jgi:hypothetical protein
VIRVPNGGVAIESATSGVNPDVVGVWASGRPVQQRARISDTEVARPMLQRVMEWTRKA